MTLLEFRTLFGRCRAECAELRAAVQTDCPDRDELFRLIDALVVKCAEAEALVDLITAGPSRHRRPS